MKKTKWTKDDFRVGDNITVTTPGGNTFTYNITKILGGEFRVKEGGSIDYYQIHSCDYDITFNDRPELRPLYKIKI